MKSFHDRLTGNIVSSDLKTIVESWQANPDRFTPREDKLATEPIIEEEEGKPTKKAKKA